MMTIHLVIFGLQAATIVLVLRHDVVKYVKSIVIVMKNGKDKPPEAQ